MMKRNYEHTNHAKYKIRYHLIFSTKYRKKCLKGIEEDVRESFRRAESLQDKWHIEVMDIDREKIDHIHLLIRSSPSCSVEEIVHKLKQVSVFDIWQKHHDHMRKFYWRGKHCLWTRGYFCSSVGDVSEEGLKRYIEKQG